jgi:hypothetical protein
LVDFFLTTGFLVAFFLTTGFLVALVVAPALAFGVGLADGDAAMADVVESVRIEIKNVATSFFNLCSI